MTYEEIIAAKGRSVIFEGIHRTREDMPAAMFPHQVDLTLWALRKGRAAVFADVGLGKSIMQLTWAREVVRESKVRGGRARVLIAAPLAVARQTVREGEKWGIPVTYCRGSDESACEIVVTNYDQLDHFDPANFDGFALDESSILKSFTGAMRNQIIDTWGGCHDRGVRYRSAWSATPAPNDFTELGNHSEFLGVKTRTEMLSEFFVHDGGAVQDWRLKGHAVTHFWRWLATWGAVVRSPADLGHDDAAYRLPPKRMHHHVIDVEFDPSRGTAPQLGMFALDAGTLHEQRAVRRETIEERVAKVVDIVGRDDRPHIVWCALNDEADAIEAALPGSIQIAGADTFEQKEQRIERFLAGRARVLVTKPRVAGWGLNFQHCADMTFVGVTHSFEEQYQAERRIWRFGQQRECNIHVISASTERLVLENYRRKEADAARMGAEMAAQVLDAVRAEVCGGSRREWNAYDPREAMQIPTWLGQDGA